MSAKAKADKAAGTPGRDSEQDAAIGPHRSQHLALTRRVVATEGSHAEVFVDESESPLGWLARRRGRAGRSLIDPHQLLAGERLRADFTRAHMMPRTTSNWEMSVPLGSRNGNGGAAGHFSDGMIAARQRVRQALTAAGPEFAGLLLDVCCFLKGLEDVERTRGWPARSAKVVLQLALDSLARHYGLTAQASGRAQARVRTWLADDASFVVDL
jgi:hypothetical protein